MAMAGASERSGQDGHLPFYVAASENFYISMRIMGDDFIGHAIISDDAIHCTGIADL